MTIPVAEATVSRQPFFPQVQSNGASKSLLEESNLTSVSSDQVRFGLNIKYQDGLVSLITGCSYQTFTLDKEAESFWDKNVKAFLSKENVEFEEQ